MSQPLPRLSHRYELQREIGSGGMATVYLARDLKHPHRLVAIKRLRSDISGLLGPDRFLREIEIAAKLTHPHILPLLDSGESDGQPFYVMPYVEGESLRDRINREKQLPVDVALRLTEEVADGLSYAHSHAIVHRDIKPANILIEGDQAWIADFGIARALSVVAGDRLTSAGVTVGTPEYMSPEQTYAGEVDGRSDLYSLGCVLHEMLSGEPPFTGPTVQIIAARHRADPPPPLRSVRPSVSVEVEQLVQRTLEKLPADRFETGSQLAEALRGAERRSLTPIGQKAHRPTKRRRVKRWRLVVVVFAAVLASAVVREVVVRLSGPELDPNAIVVYPLAVRGVSAGDASLGEDVADVLRWRLNETALLSATLAWHALTGSEREDPSLLPPRRARQITRQLGAARYIVGTVLVGAPTRVLLELHDAAAGSGEQLETSADSIDDAHALGVLAANDVLRRALPDQSFRPSAFSHRSTAAVERFLLGQAAYRRAHFETALKHYHEALESDSLFALAAVRAAQAASWLHAPVGPTVAAGLRHAELMPEPYGSFSQGVRAYHDLEADNAVLRLRDALAASPRWPEAWMALGEVYMHLLPQVGSPDSLAEDAFARVHEAYPEFAPVLYHLIPFAVRDGDARRARALFEQFRAASRDTTHFAAMRLMAGCADGTTNVTDWTEAAEANPRAVNDAAQWLSTIAVSRPQCAIDAWRVLLAQDDRRYWFAGFLGTQSVLAATGDVGGLRDHFDADVKFRNIGLHEDLYILLADAGIEIDGRAQRAGDDRLALFTAGETLSSQKLSTLALWQIRQSNLGAAGELADSLGSLGSALSPRDGRLERLLSAALQARLALARGDTSDALWRLSRIVPTGDREELRWIPFESLGSERVLLAELLLEIGDAEGALRIASLLDSPAPVIYPIYLRRSLELRIRAAEQLGRRSHVRLFKSRLTAISQSDDPDPP